MANVVDWLVMLAEEPEFVSNFNRLCGTRLNFTGRPARSGIDALVDQACGHIPGNSDADMQKFVAHGVDLWRRIAATEAARA